MTTKTSSVLHLKRIPSSGTYDEVNFSESNELNWFLFQDDSFNEWIGKFPKGMNADGCKAILNEEIDQALILSCGILHLVDLSSRTLCSASNQDIYSDVIWHRRHGIFVTTFYSISCLSYPSLDVQWDSGRVAWDGIRFESVEGELVKGRLDDLSEEWARFEFNLATRELQSEYTLPSFAR